MFDAVAAHPCLTMAGGNCRRECAADNSGTVTVTNHVSRRRLDSCKAVIGLAGLLRSCWPPPWFDGLGPVQGTHCARGQCQERAQRIDHRSSARTPVVQHSDADDRGPAGGQSALGSAASPTATAASAGADRAASAVARPFGPAAGRSRSARSVLAPGEYGRANWTDANTAPTSATKTAAKPFNLPAIHELIIQSGTLVLLDDPRRLQVKGTIAGARALRRSGSQGLADTGRRAPSTISPLRWRSRAVRCSPSILSTPIPSN